MDGPLDALHSDESLRRHEYPVAAERVFLAHAGVCPLPRRVAAAMGSWLEAATRDDQEAAGAGELVADTRRRAAALIGADPAEVALVGPTSLALSFIASGLPWRRGDDVLVCFDDYPSNVYPWMALADRGVRVRFLNLRSLGRVRLIDVQGQVDENTRLVALASAHYLSGWRVEVDALGRWLRQRGVWFSVDAIQTLGAFPTRVEHVDFLAADSHKWLLGPAAAGVLYVRRELQERLRPVVHGWHNVRCPDFLTRERIEFRSDARRYEAGTHNLPGLAGLREALGLVESMGIDAIAGRLLRHRAHLVPALEAMGFEVLEAQAPPVNAGGVVTFHRPGADMGAIHSRLAGAGIVTSLRTLPGGARVVRMSPHYYNTVAELDRALEVLSSRGGG